MQDLKFLKECLEVSSLHKSFSDGISSIEDFKSKIPIGNYEQFYDSIIKHYQSGEGFVEDPIVYWALTSGTTSSPKFIPITQAFINDYLCALSPLFAEISIKFGTNILSPGGILPLIGKYIYSRSPIGIPVGCISGLIFHLSGQKFGPYLTYNLEEYESLSIEDSWSYIVKKSKNPNVRCILASNPAFVLDLIRIHSKYNSISSIDANLLWPNLKLIICQTGGTCRNYIDLLQNIFPNVELWDAGIGGSEGYYAKSIFKPLPIGIPNDQFYFLEYLELDSDETVSFDEMNEGKEYYLIITTRNGFIRYNTLDIITKLNNSIKFIGKADKLHSYKGERLSEIQIGSAMDIVKESLNLFNLHYNVRWNGSNYCFRIVELYKDIKVMEEMIDEALCKVNINYFYARKYYRILNEPTVQKITMGEFLDNAVSFTTGQKLLRQEKPALLV